MTAVEFLEKEIPNILIAKNNKRRYFYRPSVSINEDEIDLLKRELQDLGYTAIEFTKCRTCINVFDIIIFL